MTRHEPYEIAGYVVPEGKSVVLFVNLVDGRRARRVAGRRGPETCPESVIRVQAIAHGGEELAAKRAGLFVFVFGSVHSAARCALACHRAIDAYNRDTGDAVRLYVAAHARAAFALAPNGAGANGGPDEDASTSSDDGAGPDERVPWGRHSRDRPGR